MHDDFDGMDGFQTDPEEFARVIGRGEDEPDERFDARVITAISTSNRMQQLILHDQMLRMMVDVAASALNVGRDDVMTDTFKVMLWLTSLAPEELERRAAAAKRNRNNGSDNVTQLPGQYL